MGSQFKWKSRHTVLSILFFASIVSFMDRVAMPVAIPYIAADFHLSSLESGLVLSAFAASYSFSQIPGGILSDIFGVRKVAAIALLWWSAFTALTGAAANLTQMILARLLFGLGEGVFPACLFKSIAVWFPRKERATANAIRLASSPLGAALTPLAVVGIMSLWGWRTVFYFLFLPGALSSLLFWIFIPDEPSQSSRVSPEEIAEIEESDGVDDQIPGTTLDLLKIFKEPNVSKYFFVLFSSDIAYWGFASWLPTYLVKARGFSMNQMGVAASLPYAAGIAGTILGGWLSEKFFSNDRRIPIVGAQFLSAIFLYLIFTANSVTMLVTCLTIEGLCINFIIAAFWAIPMNTVPRNHMGVASGFINMGGQTAAFISPIFIGYLIGDAGGKYGHAFTFLIASLLVSCAIVLTLPGTFKHQQEDAVHGCCPTRK
jgi:sugar phosphate permease